MRGLLQLIIILFGFLSVTSCKSDEPEIIEQTSDTLKITVQPVFGGETLFLDSTYQTPEGYDLQFIDIKFYFEDARNGLNLFKDASLFD